MVARYQKAFIRLFLYIRVFENHLTYLETLYLFPVSSWLRAEMSFSFTLTIRSVRSFRYFQIIWWKPCQSHYVRVEVFFALTLAFGNRYVPHWIDSTLIVYCLRVKNTERLPVLNENMREWMKLDVFCLHKTAWAENTTTRKIKTRVHFPIVSIVLSLEHFCNYSSNVFKAYG